MDITLLHNFRVMLLDQRLEYVISLLFSLACRRDEINSTVGNDNVKPQGSATLVLMILRAKLNNLRWQ